MTITIKKLAILFIIFFALIFLANSLVLKSFNNVLKSAVTDEEESDIAKTSLKEKNKGVKLTEIRPWKEADAAKREKLKKYGFRIKPKYYGPSTAQDWDEYVEKRIVESKIFESEEAKEAVKTMQVNAEQYVKTIEINMEHGEIVKKQLVEEPFNKDYKERLQNIYKMRAIGKAMKNKIVVENQSLAMEEIGPSPQN